MLDTLKGGTLWAIVVVVLGVLGCATYLASQNILSGADWLVLGTAVLASAGIVTGAHVAGQTAAAAFNTPVPGPGVTLPPPAAPVPVPATPNAQAPAPVPAMPQAVT